MNERPLANLAESVRQRLLNRARATGEDFQIILNNYLFERFLYRLSRSEVKDRFVLKGAVLLRLWAVQPYRATRDLDLLRRGPPSPSALADDVRTICTSAVEPDGVVFDLDDLTVEAVREDEEYAGLRANFTARLGSARVRLQVDVGTGDAVWPAPRELVFPTLLAFPAPSLLAYAPETVVAEKLDAMVVFGIANSRIKDYFDLHYLATNFGFEGSLLAEAIRRTFERRQTPYPAGVPIGLSDDFWDLAGRHAHVRAFARRSRLDVDLASARELLPILRSFLLPPLEALGAGRTFQGEWPKGGPWSVT